MQYLHRSHRCLPNIHPLAHAMRALISAQNTKLPAHRIHTNIVTAVGIGYRRLSKKLLLPINATL